LTATLTATLDGNRAELSRKAWLMMSIVTTVSHPRPGFELDWLAVDVNGYVALLSSGGQGPIPRLVVDHLPDVEAAIEALPLLLILGRCADSPTGRGNYGFWIEPCRRGLFGFDWQRKHIEGLAEFFNVSPAAFFRCANHREP